jgi:hypothetical protein
MCVPDEPAAGDAGGLRAANARLRALLAERDAEIAVLRGQLGELTAPRAEAFGLRERAADLTARVGMNSQNSSKPPSSDGMAKPAPKSLRARSGRKPGRAKGQPGATTQFSDSPDRVVRHAVDARARDLLRDPLLPRHRRPPRHRLARRPRPGRRRHPLDPPDRINQPGNAALAARGQIGTYPVMLTAGAGLHLHRDQRTVECRRARAKPEAGWTRSGVV